MITLSVQRMLCCGWREIHNIQAYKGNFKDVLKDLIYHQVFFDAPGTKVGGGARCGGLLFSQAGTRSAYGKKFATDIEELKLGKVIKLDKFKNPNTTRIIQSYVWIPDVPAVIAFCREHKLFVKTRQTPTW